MRQETNSRIIPILLILIVFLTVAVDVTANKERDQKQAELDAICEQAREKKLAPMREEYIEECVKKKQQRDRKSCEEFYADYGVASRDRAPLFYDLPECVEAFEFQRSYRQRSAS